MRLNNLLNLILLVGLMYSCDQPIPIPACPPFSQDFVPTSDQELFLDLAFDQEFGSGASRLRKWNSPIQVYILGSAQEAVIEEINLVIMELNSLSSPGLEIEQVTNRESANFILFLGEKEAYVNQVEPEAAGFALGNSGFVTIAWNEEFEIIEASACIDVVNFTGSGFYQHVIREELAQGLGLINDTDLLDSTIFHQDLEQLRQYSPLDQRMIGFMLGEQLEPGMCPGETLTVVK